MYTLEQRQKAEGLFIATGHNESLVIRTLGYPSPNALRQWWREYEKSRTLHSKSLPKPQFSGKLLLIFIAQFYQNIIFKTQLLTF